MIYVDTNILIYLLEDHPAYSQKVAEELEKARSARTSLVTSVLTITEFMAGTDADNPTILQNIPNITFRDVDRTIAEEGAKLQRENNINIGDSIHLATALALGVNTLFTNDKKLSKIASKYMDCKSIGD